VGLNGALLTDTKFYAVMHPKLTAGYTVTLESADKTTGYTVTVTPPLTVANLAPATAPSKWVDISVDLNLGDTKDTSTAGAVKDDILQFDGAKWTPAQLPSIPNIPNGTNDDDRLSWDQTFGEWVTSANEFGHESNIKGFDTPDADGSIPVFDYNNNEWNAERRMGVPDAANVPASASDTGLPGDVAYDTDHIYFCVAQDTWIRAARDKTGGF
jgi:hypothetical protein